MKALADWAPAPNLNVSTIEEGVLLEVVATAAQRNID
jgi:hypothetical protein